MTQEKKEHQAKPGQEVLVIDPLENRSQFDFLIKMAEVNPRRRLMFPLHDWWEHENRMYNIIFPDSYIRPHKHDNRHSTDTLYSLIGRVNVVIFDEEGKIDRTIPLYGKKFVSIPPGVWHTVVTETLGVLYETKGHDVGGYNPKTDKVFPKWASEEGAEQAEEYLVNLKSQVEELTKDQLRG